MEKIVATPEMLKRFVVSVLPPLPEKLTKHRILQMEAGLTCKGTRPKSSKHPELAGLPRPEYMKRLQAKRKSEARSLTSDL